MRDGNLCILDKYEGLGLLNAAADHLALTESAVQVSDTIMADVLAAF